MSRLIFLVSASVDIRRVSLVSWTDDAEQILGTVSKSAGCLDNVLLIFG